MLTFDRFAADDRDRITIEPKALIVAGWAGRDEAALNHHIEELAALGVPRPSSVPVFYRGSASLLTQTQRLEVLGPDTSGEVEPVIVALADGLWLGVGSDHTDRKAEAAGVALSKQLCGKVVGRSLWRLDELAGRWDELVLRSLAVIDGMRVPYQDGTLAALRPPADLFARLGQAPAAGTVLFGGTVPAIGGIRPASRFEMELFDPATGRMIRHAYDVVALPVVA